MGFDRYDIIAAFDPDHVPAPAFLSEVLGCFNDPQIGYVQAPQAYYNQHASFIARGAAEESYGYYSYVQMASYGVGYPIVIGCHNTHRIAALKQVGGFAPHDADDLLITLLYRSRGWQGVYVPTILARGLTPVDWRGYLGQQRRWARAVLDLKIRSYPKISDELPWKSRLISLLHGLNYLHKSLLIPMGLIVLALLLSTGIASNVFTGETLFRLVVLLAALELCELYRQRFYLDWKNEWGLHWRAGLLQLSKWPYVLLALFDVLVDRRIPYVLTPKVSNHSKASMLMGPQFVVVAVLSTAWIVAILKGVAISPFLHLCTAAVVAMSLLLILTEWFTFPAPYTGSSDLPKAHTPLPGSSLTETP
jgi:cellulose synthase (UDP-forming)